MATTIKPCLPLSPLLKHSISPPPNSSVPCKPYSDPLQISRLAHFHHHHHRPQFAASVAFNPQGNFDISAFEEDDTPKVEPPMPPSEGRFEVVIDNSAISSLDLTSFQVATGMKSPLSVNPKEYLERTIGFTINYTREDPRDPRELYEFPDIRLWFVRLDATYPWLPVLLDWRAGELARYAAMLVPHQMNMRMGVVFNPEALELFMMKKVFIVYSWLKHHNIPKPEMKTNDMARMLGFGIGNELYDLIENHPLDLS